MKAITEEKRVYFDKAVKVVLMHSVIKLENGGLRGIYGKVGYPEKVKVWGVYVSADNQPLGIAFTNSDNVGEYVCEWQNLPEKAQKSIMKNL